VILKMRHLFFYQTPIGEIAIAEENDVITRLCFQSKDILKDMTIHETKILKEAGKQLKEYMEGKRKEFTLPLAPVGTEFMIRVWKSLCAIPYGETRSYKEIAESIGNKKASRAVGLANNRNPIPIFIPCHRVIGANGKLVGYGGGLHIKSFLLKLEMEYKN
jgi:methylated-DNA-[protein]-cysteine S-methyltransferase